MPRTNAILALSLAVLCAPAFGQSANPDQPSTAQPSTAQPGTVNYVEGQASLNGSPLNRRSVGRAAVEPGELLQTGNGRAEILLTPGVFLRVGDDSTIKMIAPDLTHTEVSLIHGKADVEVDQVFKQNDLLIDQGNSQTQLLRDGLYSFSVPSSTLRVFDGKAAVFPMAQDGNVKPVIVKGDHELALNGDGARTIRFDKQTSEDGLYNWSSLRSQYLGEENQNLASEYAGVGGFGPGWYWDSAFFGYDWLPGEGAFLSPFGYGFYSPLYFGEYGGYGGYGYGRGVYGGRGFRGSIAGARAGGFSGGGFSRGGGFHGGGLGRR